VETSLLVLLTRSGSGPDRPGGGDGDGISKPD